MASLRETVGAKRGVGVVALGVAILAAAAAACSSEGGEAEPGTGTDAGGAPTCNPAACLPGNECLSDGKETICRLVCAIQEDCPFNYHCEVRKSAPKPFCVKDRAVLQRKPGQWGVTCLPSGGQWENPACDVDNGFACYGRSPTDAQAYCTRFDCVDDADCPGGWTCGSINASPNVESTDREFFSTMKVCRRREYCAPCSTDLDCPKTEDGSTQYCVTDATGEGRYCTRECTRDANCALDAVCAENDEVDGAKLCRPRSGVCRGDGSLCAPCGSDADCAENSVCVEADYSTERFCSEAVSACSKCPKNLDGIKISCLAEESAATPKNHCVGTVAFGGQNVLGCWTRARK